MDGPVESPANKWLYSKPSLIQLKLIRIEVWKSKNSDHRWVRALKDTWDLGARGIRARGLSGCVEDSRRDWNHARKYPRYLELDEGDPGFQLLTGEEIAAVIYFLFFYFINTTCVIKFSIYLFSKFFLSLRAIICFTNPDDLPIQLIHIAEGLLYIC
jgi:hypothetical protein